MEKINGFISAPFTPMLKDGAINYNIIPEYAALYQKNGIEGAFICGTSGEGFSLTMEERMNITEKWIESASENFKTIVHVGGSSLKNSQELARHAESSGAWGIGTMAPVFFKPSTVEDLVTYCEDIASASPGIPLYFYHIPGLTDVHFLMADFLEIAKARIPNLAGIKYTHGDLYDFSRCIQIENSRFDILHGQDETFLAGLALGATGGAGGTYNHIVGIYIDIKKAFIKRDLNKAKDLQWKAQRFIHILLKYGGNVVAGKKIMKFIGLDCGPNRKPVRSLSLQNERALKKELINIGFFDFCNK